MNRLFIALPVDSKIIDTVFNIILQEKNSNLIKWEKKENIHITLKFIGDTEDRITDEIIKILDKVAISNSSFSLATEKFGAFYRNKKPSILWLGFYENETLNKLQNDIENRLELIGIKKEERKFHSHVTLLRVKNERDEEVTRNIITKKIDEIEYKINEFYLVKSILTPNGSIYKKLKTFKLK